MGNSGAKSSGPAGSSVPGWSAGGGGDGRSGTMLYQAVGISLSSSRYLCWWTVSSMAIGVPPCGRMLPTITRSGAPPRSPAAGRRGRPPASGGEGYRSAHGVAASSWEATRMSWASWNAPATSCTPTGRPDGGDVERQAHGRLAGDVEQRGERGHRHDLERRELGLGVDLGEQPDRRGLDGHRRGQQQVELVVEAGQDVPGLELQLHQRMGDSRGCRAPGRPRRRPGCGAPCGRGRVRGRTPKPEFMRLRKCPRSAGSKRSASSRTTSWPSDSSSIGRVLDGGQRLGSHLDAEGRDGVDGDPQPARVGPHLVGEGALLARRAPPGQRVGAAHDVEDGRGVGHRAGHDALDRQPRPAGVRSGTRPRLGLCPTRPQHDAGIRIEPPPSLALAAGNMPDGHGRRRAAARAAGGVGRVPRVAGGPEPQVLGDADRAELGRVGPAAEDESGVDEGPGDQLGLARPARPSARRAVGDGLAGHRRPGP